jgi:hypothetical protein
MRAPMVALACWLGPGRRAAGTMSSVPGNHNNNNNNNDNYTPLIIIRGTQTEMKSSFQKKYN